MFSKIMKIGASFAGALLGTLSMIGDANADNHVITHGAAAAAFNASESNLIDYISQGARTVSTSPQMVIVPVVRSPATTGVPQGFYVDGTNTAGQTTSFTLTAFDYNGSFQSSVSFSSNLANYDLFQQLSPITVFSYVNLLATLPANGNGVLLGVTALKP